MKLKGIPLPEQYVRFAALISIFFWITGCGIAPKESEHLSQLLPSGNQAQTSPLSLNPASEITPTSDTISFNTPFGPFPVTWAVNGIAGGSSVLGTVDLSGNYTAPPVPPSVSIILSASLPGAAQNPQALSASAAITVVYPQPQVTQVAPSAVPLGSPALSVAISGNGFRPASTATVDGQPVPVEFLDFQHLAIDLQASAFASARVENVVISNPSPGGGTAPSTLTVLNPVPMLTLVSPSAVIVSGNSTNLELAGSGFLSTSSVIVGEQNLPIQFLSDSNIEVVVAGNSLASGELPISISNSGPGGGTSLAHLLVLPSSVVSGTSNPLVASYQTQLPEGSNVYVNFGPDKSYGFKTSPVQASVGGGQVQVLVAGMRPNTTYHMEAVISLPDGSVLTDADHTFTAGALPSKFGFPQVTTTSLSSPEPGLEFLNLVTPGEVVLAATDLAGNFVWYYDPGDLTFVTEPAKLLPNGHVLVLFNSSGSVDGSNSVMREIDLAGNTIWQMTTDDFNNALAAAGFNLTIVGTHHDFALLPNGHLVVIAATVESFQNLAGFPGSTKVTGDVLIDLDENRKPVWVWSEFDHLDVNRHPLGLPDWTHTNAVLYSSDDGNLVVSVRNQHWVIKVDYRDGTGTGDVLWKLGWQGDFQLIGGSDPSDWFFAQHAPHFASQNTAGVFDLLLFDNGDSRVLDSQGDVCTTTCTSTVPWLRIDEGQKTATIIWRDNLGLYSFFGGYVQNLPNGDIEIDVCAAASPQNAAFVEEVTDEKPTEPVWQMSLTGVYAYRAFRLPSLYPGVQWP